MAYVQISREEIVSRYREVVAERGVGVSLREFLRVTGIAESQVRKHFAVSWSPDRDTYRDRRSPRQHGDLRSTGRRGRETRAKRDPLRAKYDDVIDHQQTKFFAVAVTTTTTTTTTTTCRWGDNASRALSPGESQ